MQFFTSDDKVSTNFKYLFPQTDQIAFFSSPSLELIIFEYESFAQETVQYTHSIYTECHFLEYMVHFYTHLVLD